MSRDVRWTGRKEEAEVSMIKYNLCNSQRTKKLINKSENSEQKLQCYFIQYKKVLSNNEFCSNIGFIASKGYTYALYYFKIEFKI